MKRDTGFRRGGLRLRLIAIALVPILGFSVWTVGSSVDRYLQVRHAHEMSQRMARLGMLFQARVLLDQERLPTEASAKVREFGVPSSLAAIVLGFDPGVEMKRVRAASTPLYDQLGLDVERNELRDLRSAADSKRSFDQVLPYFIRLDELLLKRSEAELATVTTLITDLDRQRELTLALGTLVAAQTLNDSFGRETALMFALSISPDESDELRRDLTIASANADDAMKELAFGGRPRVLAGQERLQSQASYQASQQLVRSATLGTPRPQLSGSLNIPALLQAGKDFATLMDRTSGARELLALSIEESRTLAESISTDAQRVLAVTIATSVSLALFSIAVAMRFARSIAKPLLDLATRATQISKGDLSNPTIAEQGPVEIVRVIRAVNDLVGNLAVLDRQATALAEGQLTSDAFNTALPGELGRSIQGTVDQLRDSIQQQNELHTRLAHQASHDELTGLPNRKLLDSALSGAIARAQRNETSVAVLFVDLDGFKQANDTHGHQVGDDVLVEVAHRIRTQLRSSDFGCRMGGDEFVVVLENVAVVADVVVTAQRYIDTISKPIRIGDHTVQVGASIGVACSSADTTASSLLHRADIAVYRAKAQGRGRVVLDEPLLTPAIGGPPTTNFAALS